MKAARQTTLRDTATVSGIGVHSGLPVTLSIHPADANYGISFMRTGIEGRADREVRADVRAVTATEFATVLGDAHGPLCSTAEHVLAALSGLGVDNALIGRQNIAMDVTPETFRKEVSRARTFGFMRDVSKLWSAGYALGATFENTLVVSDNRVLNAEGLRFADEFVRHKALDAIGDLALAGAPLLGAYRSIRGGHKLNHAVLCALMADASAWAYVDAGQVARRHRGQADVATGMVAPVFGPDVS